MGKIEFAIGFTVAVLVCFVGSIIFIPPSPSHRIDFDQVNIDDTNGDYIIRINGIYRKLMVCDPISSTGSMKPSIDAGSTPICIEPVSPDEIQRGDIISFTKCDHSHCYHVPHRVILKLNDDTFLTKGDYIISSIDIVHFDNIWGIFVGVFY